VICPPEAISALARLRRDGRITPSQYNSAKDTLGNDVEDISVCGIANAVVEKAIGRLESMPLKTLDALPIAGAIEWDADVFVSADRRQLETAKKAGLCPLSV
jgi:predicted nucleic acid-binding protein